MTHTSPNHQRLYFHDIPFKGRWHMLDKSGNVEFTWHQCGCAIRNMTLDEYKDAHPNQQYSNILTEDEAGVVTAEWERKTYLEKDPHVISDEDWVDALNVLPPLRWGKHSGVEMFCISEANIGNIHDWYLRSGGICLSFADRVNASTDSLVARFAATAKSISESV